jgi:DNA-binding transcriptional ArsR family regulator
MTQEAIIRVLQNGPLTSQEVANLTGMPQATILSTAKKLRYQGKLSTKHIKVGRYWVAQYTLADQEIDNSDNGVKIICGIKTYGIFTKAEYASMKAQATRLLGKPAKKEITNNQFI